MLWRLGLRRPAGSLCKMLHQIRERGEGLDDYYGGAMPCDWPAVATVSLRYGSLDPILTPMEKIQVYLRKEELDALRVAAKRSGRSVAELVREAVRKVVL